MKSPLLKNQHAYRIGEVVLHSIVRKSVKVISNEAAFSLLFDVESVYQPQTALQTRGVPNHWSAE